jgi:general secretion pathway protein L
MLRSASLEALLRRWRLQILQCLPRRPRQWLAARHPDLVISIQNDEAILLRDIIGERKPIGAIALQPASALGAVLQSVNKEAWRDRILELPANLVLSRRFTLPERVRDNLRQILTYELDRLTPFAATEVLFDARVLATTAQGSKIDVELALCPRQQANAWLDPLRAAGFPLSKLTWAGAWSEANLLPPEARARTWRLSSLVPWLLLLVILGLLAATLMTPLWQASAYQARITQALRGVTAEAQEVATVREALEAARRGSVEVFERKQQYPRMTDLLLELTQLLPDGTWIQTLNYNDGTVDIRGESTQATALIGLLERGAGISNVTFRSPVMQVATSGSDRFHVAFDYQTPDQPPL